MNIKRLNIPRRSRGIALVVALIILLVLTLLGVAMLNSSNLQERMSGNQKRIADSSMAAEGALQEHIGWLRTAPLQRWAAVHPDQGQFVNYGFAATSRFIIDSWDSFGSSPATPCTNSDSRCVLNVRGQSFAGQEVLAQTRLRAIVRYFTGTTPLGGDKDIWTSGDIRVNGNAFLTNTYAHADAGVSEVTITGGNTTLTESRVTTNGTANINLDQDDTKRCIDCSILDASDGFNESMPPPDFYLRIQEWRKEVEARETVTFAEIADDGTFPLFDPDGTGGVSIANDITAYGGKEFVGCESAQTFTLDTSGLQDGGVYFVNGNVDIQGGANTTLDNVTVIATCNMTHNGALRQTGGATAEINNVFYAGGDMTFNGSTGQPPGTEFQGRFFGGGDMTQNGRSLLTGQIIINGDLTLNGTFNFTGANSLGGGSDTSIGDGRVVLLDWGQVWN